MKKHLILILILVLLVTIVGTALAEKGPVPDKVYFDVRMKKSIGIQDVIKGNTDLFLEGVETKLINNLSSEELSNLEVYSVPALSYTIPFNPYPNKEPYTVEKDDETLFNPFAIKQIRFAMNFLINRQYIVDEIMDGGGAPMFDMATPGQPGTYKYNEVSVKKGFTAEGDEEKALNMIDEAMNKAAALPENEGKLVKEDDQWVYDGEPVTLKFYMRADDPEVRIPLGEYVANQIEKAGFKVERLVRERSKCTDTVYFGRPENYEWNLLTEAWSAGATRAWWEHIVGQMYASWGGFTAGAMADGWVFKNEELDQISEKAYSGNFVTEEEYWDYALQSLEMGLEESQRIYIAYSEANYLANKDRLEDRFAYGLGDGPAKYSVVTADTKDDVLNITELSSQGSLFMSAWDPVGTGGFDDTYINYMAGPLYDNSSFESRSTAETTWLRAVADMDESYTDVSRNEDGEVVGNIEVPADAIKYDPVEEEWVEVGSGKTSYTKGVYDYRMSNYHHGIPMSVVDFMYADAFIEEWSSKDSDNDPYYDRSYADYMNALDIGVGTIYDIENDRAINYFDYNFPADPKRAFAQGAPYFTVTASGHYAGVSWEINEALARMVAEGSDSGKKYSFSQGKEGTEEVDLLTPSHVKDLKAELQKMIDEQHVPVSIEDYVSAEECIERYQAALDFINKYDHGYISNGPFYLSEYDSETNFAELTAFRDESYPFEPGHWMEQFESERLVVDELDAPVMVDKGEKVPVDIYVTGIVYPEKDGTLAEEGNVTLTLLAGDKEYEFQAEAAVPGVFFGEIPAEITAELESGSYKLMAVATAENAIPSTVSTTVVIN
ncbi:MAG: ABC transporter substrate-binding protein [Halothermotrichaceae bacterium]